MKFIEKKRWQRIFTVFAILCLAFAFCGITAFAAGTTGTASDNDALKAVNNLSDFIFGIVRAIGMILTGFGILSVGLSFKSHDASQRAQGFLTIAGGIIILFAKEILNLITGG